MEATNQLKLYSISAAAKVVCVGFDAPHGFVVCGRIGCSELVCFHEALGKV